MKASLLKNLEHIFDRFYRGDDTSTLSGFGLGLAIAKTLVDEMEGEIAVESQVGQGSTVILQLRSLA